MVEVVGVRVAHPEDYERIVAVIDEWWGRPVSASLPRPVVLSIDGWLTQRHTGKVVGVGLMLMRTDPFRDLDRFTQQVFGTAARPAVMPMDAWRQGDAFVVEFDLPGVSADSLDLDVERNTLTVHAERPARDQNQEMVASERPTGVFSRQLFLGDNLDTDKIDANYEDGVLRLTIPVAEKAKPRKVAITNTHQKKCWSPRSRTSSPPQPCCADQR